MTTADVTVTQLARTPDEPRIVATAAGFSAAELALRRAKVNALVDLATQLAAARDAAAVYAGADAVLRSTAELAEFGAWIPSLASTLEGYRQRIAAQIQAFDARLYDGDTGTDDLPAFTIVRPETQVARRTLDLGHATVTGTFAPSPDEVMAPIS